MQNPKISIHKQPQLYVTKYSFSPKTTKENVMKNIIKLK